MTDKRINITTNTATVNISLWNHIPSSTSSVPAVAEDWSTRKLRLLHILDQAELILSEY
jgi:hypothetical protein